MTIMIILITMLMMMIIYIYVCNPAQGQCVKFAIKSSTVDYTDVGSAWFQVFFKYSTYIFF